MAIGLGELGLNPWEFYRYTMEEFAAKLQGMRAVKIEQWQHTRAICFTMAKPHLKSKHMTIQKFWPLPGDESTGGLAAIKSREEKMKAYLEIRQWYVDRGHLN